MIFGVGAGFVFSILDLFRLLAGKLFVLEGRADPILEGGAGVAALVLSQRVHYAAILTGAIPTRVADVLRQRKHSRATVLSDARLVASDFRWAASGCDSLLDEQNRWR